MVKHRIFVVFPWVVSKCSYILNSELLETKQNSVEMGLPAEMCPEPWSLVSVHRGGLQVYMKNEKCKYITGKTFRSEETLCIRASSEVPLSCICGYFCD